MHQKFQPGKGYPNCGYSLFSLFDVPVSRVRVKRNFKQETLGNLTNALFIYFR